MTSYRPTLKPGALLAGLLLFLTCGGGHDGQTLAIEPEAPAVMVGETLALTARPQADQAPEVDWEVQELYGGGLLQSQGQRVTYVPPEAAGTYHLLLHTQDRSGRLQKQVVEVRVLPCPMMEPASARVAPGGALSFRVHFKGLSRDSATWAVEEAEGGEATPDGRFVAPRKPGTYHVIATSTLDPSACARATVTVGDN